MNLDDLHALAPTTIEATGADLPGIQSLLSLPCLGAS